MSPAPIHLPLAVVLRYLAALTLLAPSHGFARQMQNELADCEAPVADYIEPIWQAPMHTLTPDEQVWRRCAERITSIPTTESAL